MGLVFSALFCGATTPDKTREKTLFEGLTGMEKKHDFFNLHLNTRMTFNGYFNDGNFTKGAFKVNQLRIEANGRVNDWLSYQWKQLLNVSSRGQQLDNMPNSIDCAGVGFRVSPTFSVFAGKQCAAFGGFEFDADPVEVYQFSDMGEFMTCFLTGVDFAYEVSVGQQLRFQVVDARNNRMEEMFGKVAEGVEEAKLPLGYSLNWNGSFWDKLLRTRWSATLFNEAKDELTYYYALGVELNVRKFNMYVDFMYSDEGLDRLGVISNLLYETGEETRAMDVKYVSWVTKLNYRFLSKWNVFAKGMYETASVSRANLALEKGKYRTSYGYMGGIEYYPMEEGNLHFFANYVGRSYRYTDRANDIEAFNTNDCRLSLGFIYRIPIF